MRNPDWPSCPEPDEIRAARKHAGLNQTDAAALIYRSLRGWQEWERGRSDMDPALWELWCMKIKFNTP